jgi:hypothetical protein
VDINNICWVTEYNEERRIQTSTELSKYGRVKIHEQDGIICEMWSGMWEMHGEHIIPSKHRAYFLCILPHTETENSALWIILIRTKNRTCKSNLCTVSVKVTSRSQRQYCPAEHQLIKNHPTPMISVIWGDCSCNIPVSDWLAFRSTAKWNVQAKWAFWSLNCAI